MLTRQSANSNKLETMAEEAQSGDGPVSSGEFYEPPVKINGEKVNIVSGRKRGRPKKYIGERKDSSAGDEIPEIGDSHRCGKDLMVGQIPIPRQRRNGVPKLRKTERTPLLDGQADATQFQVVSSHETDHAKNDCIMIDEDSVPDDNQTLLMCSDIRPRIGLDDSRTLPVDKQDGNGTPLDQGNAMGSSHLQETGGPRNVPDLNQCDELIDKGGELETPAIVSTDSMENEESLPFVKRSYVWKGLCSSEAYMKMKRKPHFYPLKEKEEVLREGLAIGLVINFINLVEGASKLQSSSDITAIEIFLKTLNEFKFHGFDVDKVEADLTQLRLKKQLVEDLEKDYKERESKISNNVEEGKLGDEEINQLRQKFREIEKELSEAELKKENREKALSALRLEQAAVAEKIQSINSEFEKIVGSML